MTNPTPDKAIAEKLKEFEPQFDKYCGFIAGRPLSIKVSPTALEKFFKSFLSTALHDMWKEGYETGRKEVIKDLTTPPTVEWLKKSGHKNVAKLPKTLQANMKGKV